MFIISSVRNDLSPHISLLKSYLVSRPSPDTSFLTELSLSPSPTLALDVVYFPHVVTNPSILTILQWRGGVSVPLDTGLAWDSRSTVKMSLGMSEARAEKE